MHKNHPFLGQFNGWSLNGIAKQAKEFKCNTRPMYSCAKQLCSEYKPVDLTSLRIKSLGSGNDLMPLMHKVPPLKRLLTRIRNNEDCDVTIAVRGKEFVCHNIVLGIYCKHLLPLLTNEYITISSTELSPKGFAQAYQWMTDENPAISPNDVVDLMEAAIFLGMDELYNHCWNILDHNVFNEFAAFNVLFASRHSNELSDVQTLLAGRVSNSILTIFASNEYLELHANQVSYMLRSSKLAVNSEQELLYGALLWLDHLWPMRIAHVPYVLGNIRYCYVSPIFLHKLQSCHRSSLAPFGHIYNAFYDTGVMTKIVEDGLFGTGVVISSDNNRDYIKATTYGTSIRIEEPRLWIRDRRCPYHVKVGVIVPNMLEISFDDYSKYLRKLQACDIDYDKTIEYNKGFEPTVTRPVNWRETPTLSQLQLNLDLLAAHKKRCHQRRQKPRRIKKSDANFLQHSKTEEWEKLLMEERSWYLNGDSAKNIESQHSSSAF